MINQVRKRIWARSRSGSNGRPEKITIDKSGANTAAIVSYNAEQDADVEIRQVKYLNNIVEQDHRAIKRRVNASQGFRSFWAAWRTLAGYEVIHMIRKGQACGSALAARIGLLHRFIVAMFGIEV